jgi:branched-chain amino acid transport system ATP-binding protein
LNGWIARGAWRSNHKRLLSSGETAGLRGHRILVDFDGLRAVNDVDLALARGETLGLIGPNGAGKTTLVNVMTGFQRPTSGRVEVDGIDVTGWNPARLAATGVVRTFQGIRVFRKLSVFENVEVGALNGQRNRGEARRRASEVISMMNLEDRASQPAMALSHGEQRRLGLARAFALQPRYLLLDEPAAGLSEAESDELVRSIRAFHEMTHAGVLLIEHDMRVIMGVCDRIHVLDFGRTLKVGTPDGVRADAQVMTAYLGGDETTSS